MSIPVIDFDCPLMISCKLLNMTCTTQFKEVGMFDADCTSTLRLFVCMRWIYLCKVLDLSLPPVSMHILPSDYLVVDRWERWLQESFRFFSPTGSYVEWLICHYFPHRSLCRIGVRERRPFHYVDSSIAKTNRDTIDISRRFPYCCRFLVIFS